LARHVRDPLDAAAHKMSTATSRNELETIAPFLCQCAASPFAPLATPAPTPPPSVVAFASASFFILARFEESNRRGSSPEETGHRDEVWGRARHHRVLQRRRGRVRRFGSAVGTLPEKTHVSQRAHRRFARRGVFPLQAPRQLGRGARGAEPPRGDGVRATRGAAF
jgi:hypothetical protein